MEICHICDDSFQDLKKHYYDKHTTSRKLYRCDACNKENNSEIELRKHETDFHSVHEDNKDFKCESCEKSFSQKGYLKNHIKRVHEGRKDYKCEFCGKSFSERQKLEIHISMVHEGHKDYKCESCGKSFTEAQYLKNYFF